MLKTNIFFFALIIILAIYLTFMNGGKKTKNTSQNFDSKLSKHHVIAKKSNYRVEIKTKDLDKVPFLFQPEPSKNDKKENELKKELPKETESCEDTQEFLKTEADKLIDFLFPNLFDENEEDKAIKKSLKYGFPRHYMKKFLNEEQRARYFDIYSRMTADFEYLHGTTPIVDKESEKKVNKKIREIHEQYVVEFINILTTEQQFSISRDINETWIPELKEGVRKHGLVYLQSPWYE